MRFTISRQALIEAFEMGGQACSTTTLPITKMAKVKIDKERLMVTSTSLDIFVSKRIAADYTGEPREFCLDVKALLPVLRSFKDAAVDVDIEGNQVRLIHQKGDMELTVVAADGFPKPSVDGEARPVVVDASFFVDTIKRAVKFADKGKGLERPALMGVYCYLRDGDLRIAATDGISLYIRRAVYGGDEDSFPTAGVIIPARAIPALASMIPSEGEVTLMDRERNFSVSVDGCSVLVTKVEARYPNVESVIPDYGEERSASVSVGDFLDSVNRCSLMGDSVYAGLSLSFEGSVMDIRSEDETRGSRSRETVLTSGGLDGLSVTLQASRLSTILKEIASESVTIHAVSGDRAVVFKGDGDDDTTFLLMPMRPRI